MKTIYTLIFCFAGFFVAGQATNAVLFRILDTSGGTNSITQFTVTPDPFYNPMTPDNINILGGGSITETLTCGTNISGWAIGGYTLNVVGWQRGLHFVVPYSFNYTTNVVGLITNGLPQ